MIEIQIHPGDIRRNIRYYFLGRGAVRTIVLLASLLLLMVIGSMAVAPTVIRRVYRSNFLRVMQKESVEQHVSLRKHVQEMDLLEKHLDSQRVRVEKLITVYGLDTATAGKGGLQLPGRSFSSGDELEDARKQEIDLKRSVLRLRRQLELIATYERENASMVRHTPSIMPLPAEQFVLTSPFGSRISPFTKTADFHKGLDLASPLGTPIVATADGVVTFAGRYPISQSVAWWRFGNVVVVNHADRFITIYGHCDTTQVVTGQQIRQGQVIATVGSTGWSTNSHLHYEVRSDMQSVGTFEPIDPRIYILDYLWTNEEKLLISARKSKDYRNFDPLPTAFIGRRRS